jgi:hypothetical protein
VGHERRCRDLSTLEPGVQGRRVGHLLQDKPVDQRAATEVAAVGLQRDRLLRHRRDQLERAGAHEVLADLRAVLVQRGSGNNAARDVGQSRQERHVRLDQRELDRVLVHRAHTRDIPVGRPAHRPRRVRGPARVLVGELAVERAYDVLCGERTAVVKSDIVAQGQGERLAVVGDLRRRSHRHLRRGGREVDGGQAAADAVDGHPVAQRRVQRRVEHAVRTVDRERDGAAPAQLGHVVVRAALAGALATRGEERAERHRGQAECPSPDEKPSAAQRDRKDRAAGLVT